VDNQVQLVHQVQVEMLDQQDRQARMGLQVSLAIRAHQAPMAHQVLLDLQDRKVHLEQLAHLVLRVRQVIQVHKVSKVLKDNLVNLVNLGQSDPEEMLE
jgi:hypothetical protein